MATVAKSQPSPPPPQPPSLLQPWDPALNAHGRRRKRRRVINASVHFLSNKKMASSQGGVNVTVTALHSQQYCNGAQWNSAAGGGQQHQQHTARSLDRALDDAVCSGNLNLSGRKLREYPGVSYDLTDTTQAGGWVGGCSGSWVVGLFGTSRTGRCCPRSTNDLKKHVLWRELLSREMHVPVFSHSPTARLCSLNTSSSLILFGKLLCFIIGFQEPRSKKGRLLFCLHPHHE